MKLLIQFLVFAVCSCLNAYAVPFFKDLGYALGILVFGDQDGAAMMCGLLSGALAILVYGVGFVVAKRINERRLDGSLKYAPGIKRTIFALPLLLADAAITGSAGTQTPFFGSGDFVVPASGAQLLYDLLFLSTFHWMGVLGLASLIWGLVAFCRRVPATTWSAVRKVEADTDSQQFNLNDPQYGLVPEKPVYCFYYAGSLDYLDSLRTDSGEKLLWNRRGSRAVDGIKGMVDIYDSTLPSGQSYKTVYVNMYANSNSTTAPAGFVFYHSENKTATPAPTTSKSKTRFCKLCGDPIDPVTRKCTGCRKQYFRLPVFTGKHYFIAVTAVACVLAAVLLVMLLSQRSTYETQIAELTARVSELEDELAKAEDEVSAQSRIAETHKATIENQSKTLKASNETIKDLREENSDMRAEIRFYDNHVVFIGDDGTRKYHNYDCPYLDMSEGFYAYNTENAKAQGYKPCSHCCD